MSPVLPATAFATLRYILGNSVMQECCVRFHYPGICRLFLFDVTIHIFNQQILIQLLPTIEHVLSGGNREVGQEIDRQLRILFVQQQSGSIDSWNLLFVTIVDFVDYLDNIFADQIVTKISEVGYTVEEPKAEVGEYSVIWPFPSRKHSGTR